MYFIGLMVANTDTIWYLGFTDNIYRFFPTILNEEDTLRYHGDNERISVDIYAQSVSFYHRIIHNADAMYDHAGETS
jgi:carboxypeptidase PM20D1